MMDRKIFQEKLGQIVALASEKQNNLTQEDVLSMFGENQLNTQQMQSLYEYLRLQGICIDGINLQQMELPKQDQAEDEPAACPVTGTALEAEDEAYYAEYKAFVADLPVADKVRRESLLQAYAGGNMRIQEELTQSYQSVILELARAMYQKSVFLADLIQEGNMSLLLMDPWDIPQEDADAWVQEMIVLGMKEWIALQAEQKLQDEYMVEKVKKLEAAIRELSDDDNQKFSVEELSSYLDMDEDEIRDILSLAGEAPEGE